ncbi:Transmembrane 9 superfamily member 6 [Hibiscus syriacus]|uniref:Transmembrane 9 superfamily member n=1 Tax=Hibiscus syriacus TaxID=106335 RepID=A0A6A2YF10_HIBSY|nr:Transmembrane 9 superfamily member 6 [Hibiscus syriacus]
MTCHTHRFSVAWTLFAFFFLGARCFYLPGVAPEDFQKGDPLLVKVNKLTSTKTLLPYSYYSLPYCQPEHILDVAENLGEILPGDRIENSPYVFKMREPQMCNVVCPKILDKEMMTAFRDKIEYEYRVNMILDNLPLVVPIKADQENAVVYQQGFHSKKEKHFIYNRLSFTVKYHMDPPANSTRIVGFGVNPFNVKHEYDGHWNEKTRLITCDPHAKRAVTGSEPPQELDDKEIIFTYDVDFQESDIKWAFRWNSYLLVADDQVHWFSIFNSLMIALFLSGMVAMIMLRALYRDISKYNQLENQEEVQVESGWKLVHGDVFRPPTNFDLLCALPLPLKQRWDNDSHTSTLGLHGHVRRIFIRCLYKKSKGTEWKKITLKTAVMFPATVSAIFSVLNALIWGQKSSGAVPFGTMFALVFLWFGISVQLVFVGGYICFKKPAIEDTVKTNKIPRQIPKRVWYMNSVFFILIGGILPFGVIFIELFFILTSIWLHQFYYIFGFLFIVFVILIVTSAEITIVICYFQLCSEDYLWWWRSYLTSGSSGLYLFLYSAYYFFTKLEITKPEFCTSGISTLACMQSTTKYNLLASSPIHKHRNCNSEQSSKLQRNCIIHKQLCRAMARLQRPLVRTKKAAFNKSGVRMDRGMADPSSYGIELLLLQVALTFKTVQLQGQSFALALFFFFLFFCVLSVSAFHGTGTTNSGRQNDDTFRIQVFYTGQFHLQHYHFQFKGQIREQF